MVSPSPIASGNCWPDWNEAAWRPGELPFWGVCRRVPFIIVKSLIGVDSTLNGGAPMTSANKVALPPGPVEVLESQAPL